MIYYFEEAGDWNRACCQSNIKEKKNAVLLYFEKPFK